MPRKERERRYIAEYMRETWPEGEYQLNVELGPIPGDYVQRYGMQKAAALVRPSRPRVDAVKWLPDRYILIEAKVREFKAGLGDLMVYRTAAEQAPDLPYYDGQPLALRMVIPWMLDWLMPLARENNIEVVVYPKDWIEEYVRERQQYFTKEYRDKRAETMQLRKVLGVD